MRGKKITEKETDLSFHSFLPLCAKHVSRLFIHGVLGNFSLELTKNGGCLAGWDATSHSPSLNRASLLLFALYIRVLNSFSFVKRTKFCSTAGSNGPKVTFFECGPQNH